MVPPAPSLFSMTTACPRVRVMAAPSVRATTSVAPPAAKGTIRVTVRDGYACPHAMPMDANATAAAASVFIGILISPPPLLGRDDATSPPAKGSGSAERAVEVVIGLER